jgi:hypothetical protein
MSEVEQLDALARLHQRFDRAGIDYWLFGGWAVDFHVGRVTRAHEDLDVAVWMRDQDRIASLLSADGWQQTSDTAAEGYIGYQRSAVRLEVAFLERGDDERVYTPVREGRADWPDEAFGDDVAELRGVRAKIISLAALRADKAALREDPKVAAKDRADTEVLARLRK